MIQDLLIPEEFLQLDQLKSAIELSDDTSFFSIIGIDTKELSLEFNLYFKENFLELTLFDTNSDNIFQDILETKQKDNFLYINLYEKQDEEFIKNLLFYRDFISDYDLQVIIFVDNLHYDYILKNAIDLYTISTLNYNFTTYKVDILESVEDNALDKLLSEYTLRKKELSKIQKVSLLSEIGTLYGDQEDIHLGLKYLNEALLLSQKIKYKKAIIHVKSALGRLYRYINKYDISEKYLLECKEYYKKEKNINGYKTILEYLALLYSDKLDYKNGLKYCLELHTVSKDANDKEMELASLNVYSLIYTKMKDNKNKEIYFRKALELAESLNDNFILADLYQDKVISLISENNYNEALKYLKKSILFYKKEKKKTMIQKLYRIYAHIYFEISDFKKSLVYAHHCYVFFKFNNLNEDTLQISQIIALNYHNLNIQDKAIVYMVEALKISKILKKSTYIFYILIDIIDIYIENENFKMANHYLNEANKFNKKLDNSDLILLYISSAMLSKNSNEIEKSYFYYNKARELTPDDFVLDELYGEILLKDNQEDKSLVYFEKSYNVARKDNDSKRINSIELNLGFVYKKLNNKPMARKFFMEVLNRLEIINKEDKRIKIIHEELELLK